MACGLTGEAGQHVQGHVTVVLGFEPVHVHIQRMCPRDQTALDQQLNLNFVKLIHAQVIMFSLSV